MKTKEELLHKLHQIEDKLIACVDNPNFPSEEITKQMIGLNYACKEVRKQLKAIGVSYPFK